MKLEPLRRDRVGRAIDRRAIHCQPAALDRERHGVDLEELHERPELHFLALLRAGIAKQVQRAREESGERLGDDHGGEESNASRHETG